jgi:hypothetical protein
MAADMHTYQPFENYWSFSILAQGAYTSSQSDLLEQNYIQAYDTVQKGYNTLEGQPMKSKKFWAMKYRT